MVFRLLIAALLLLAATGCKHNKRATTTVTRRAAFDLSCPKEELRLNVIDTEGARKMASQIAVRGCEQKAVYVYYPDSDTWIIDGARDSALVGLSGPAPHRQGTRKTGRQTDDKGREAGQDGFRVVRACRSRACRSRACRSRAG